MQVQTCPSLTLEAKEASNEVGRSDCTVRMLALVNSLVRATRLYLMRRRQFDNMPLRRYFAERYDIEVGLYSYGCFDPWRMPGPMRVGRYCSIASSVRVIPMNHPPEALTTYPALYERSFGVVTEDRLSDMPLVIEDDVWIGHNAIILPGCKHIGRGAIVGAGSVVTRNVASYTIVAGNPARKLRDRFEPALSAAIDASLWWTLELSDLARLAREHPELTFKPTIEAIERWRPPAQNVEKDANQRTKKL
jgi:virginiamycin A acetyltransferase